MKNDWLKLITTPFMPHGLMLFVSPKPAATKIEPLPAVPILRPGAGPRSAGIDMRETLIEARSLIAQGWTRGMQQLIYNERAYYCSVGAVVQAVTNLFGMVHDAGWRHRLIEDVVNVLYQHVPRPAHMIGYDASSKTYIVMDYNDRRADKSEVLALFDRSIASIRVPHVAEAERALIQA
jgi:hypothetical protein